MRIIDLSLPVDTAMPGVDIRPSKRLEVDGWNASTLTLYSHAGTHMDAPKHFLASGASLDEQDLSVLMGPALVLELTTIQPGELIQVSHLAPYADRIGQGSRLLFQTNWYRHYGTQRYRDELPRISVGLARWLVDRQVALIGVEPPSVADVNDLKEVTEVHQILFNGGVVIVEGLAYLDQLGVDEVEFIALPLRIANGDGCPVRAVAIVKEQPHG